MKKLIICNVPMNKKTPEKYVSTDLSLPTADKKVLYPVNAFLNETLQANDVVKVLLLTKNTIEDHSKENAERFITEFEAACQNTGARIEEIKEINTDFSEERNVHESLLLKIVNEINPGDHIISDITYGPKDMPIIIFTALNFAEQYLKCSIDNIVYGQAEFNDLNQVVNSKICDMVPLYYLNSITNTISCVDPDRAKVLLAEMLKL